MFTPKRTTPNVAQFNSARVTRSQSLKTKNELASPRFSVGAGSTLSASVIYSDSLLESYKSSLPIKVSEIISQASQQELALFTASILPNQHICFLTEKKLFVWKLRKSYKNIQCNELSLPSSRTRIKADCVHVECYNNKDYVTLCVTSEGLIRYWPSIFNEFLYIDMKIDLSSGDEAAYLTLITRNSYLMVTSNGQLWNINIEVSNGQNNIVPKLIDASGLFSGIGKRMTSFIFGGGAAKSSNFKCALRYGDSREIYILCDKTLHKWKINMDNSLTLAAQINMEKLFYEAYINENPNFQKCHISFQNASITKNSVYVLAIIHDEGYQFAVGELDVHTIQDKDVKLKAFHILNYQLDNNEAQTLFYMHSMDNQHAFYINNANRVISFTGPTLEFMGDAKFQTSGDRIISSGLCDSELIYFSINNGLLKVRDTKIGMSIPEESLLNSFSEKTIPQQSFAIPNITSTSFHDASNMSIQSDESFNLRSMTRQSADFTLNNISSEQTSLLRFKAAFQLYLRKEEKESENILNELFKTPTSLDELCVELSEKLIDDIPSHDTRWAESNIKGIKTSNVIITNQLNGKLRIHEYFISFLKAFQLWKSINVAKYNNREILTRLVLEEHGEKLQCALTIREQCEIMRRDQTNTKYMDLLNSAIEYTIQNRESAYIKLNHPHDAFYQRVSKINDIFNSLLFIEQDVIKNNSTELAVTNLIDTTNLFIKLIKTSHAFFQTKSKLYESQNPNEKQLEYIRWPYLPTKDGATGPAIELSIKQYKLCSEYGLLNCSSIDRRSMLLDSLYELACLIFDEYKLRLESIKNLNQVGGFRTDYLAFEKSYTNLKTRLIDVFVKNKLIDKALKLAEEYVDFQTLVVICEMNEDCDLLRIYLDKFSRLDFAEFVVNYFTDRKKFNFLLRNDFLVRDEISSCLDNHKTLSWIKDVKTDEFSKAANTLEGLALQENDSFAKRKSLLSLSKLSLLANGDDKVELNNKLNKINRRLTYLSYIENLPQTKSVDIDAIPMFKPEKLIELYITKDSTEYEFKKAFELIEYINDDTNTIYNESQLNELKLKIFIQTLLADNWEGICKSGDPETELKQTKFFKTALLMKHSGEDLQRVLPNFDQLLESDDLQERIQDNKTFAYLVKACYELLLL